ncbi:enoyl-CoA hydratase/isomerase family protein [Mycobacterium sp. Y57]|uniref:enoyl-CoA hydratase/isomerase family protein n=1 Tax=Mycolicibacterium xanthum TaxID=2796469 RepID=UPI001C84A904|nr:enoyl-CoA hydratase-related protein [Mycolicibacterium xanthum]MBX7434203.1 enoyl-CoA hydratase/isomerase family protein [Mycolicibacterium xanthum]
MIEDRRDGGVAWLTFARPQRLNSFTADDYRDLHLALAGLRDDPAVRVVVLTGHGRAFSVGADRSLLTGGDSEGRQRAGAEFDRLLEALSGFDKPLFAAVNGMAVGFGATLLLYCDVVLAGAGARFRLPFTSLGLVPEAGSSVLLPTRMRWADAMWSVLSSEWLDAAEAARSGLVWRVVADPDLAEATSTAAKQVAAQNPAAVSASKRLLIADRAELVKDGLARELHAMAELFNRQP